MVAVNTAVYLAQLGRRVLLVDSSASGATLHTMLGMPQPSLPRGEETESEELLTLETPIPGLRLLPQLYPIGSPVPLRPGRKPRWTKRLRQLDVDYVLIDIGCASTPAGLDLFLGADVGLIVSSPDPPAVEGAYRFCRLAFQRRLRRQLLRDRFHLQMLDRAEQSLGPLPAPGDLVRALARLDTGLATRAAQDLARFRPRFIVNRARSRGDTELGLAMSDMAERYLSTHLEYLGHIERDDAVWLSVAQLKPLLIDSPTSKSARNLERIARRLLSVVSRKDASGFEPMALTHTAPTLYDVLLTHRGASDDELRRAYKRQREIYRENSLPLTSLLAAEELPKANALVDEAHDTLLDPLRRRAYDISMFPESEKNPPARDPQRDAALEAERALLREELASELSADSIFTGDLLRKIRMSQAVELEDISERTKISKAYLQAIEEERFDLLPAFVYLRGFVSEVAKYLRLDVMQVTRTYLRRYRQWRNEQEH